MTRITLAVAIALSALGYMYSCSAGSHLDDKGILDGCGIVASRDIINNDTLLDLIDTEKMIRLPLSSLIDSLEIIVLEDREEAMCGMGLPNPASYAYSTVEPYAEKRGKLVENYSLSAKNLCNCGKIRYFALCFVAPPVKRAEKMQLPVI